MPQVHDRGGWPGAGPIDRTEHEYTLWEKRIDAIRAVLGQKRVLRVDELRRAIEGLGPGEYERLGYYERWITGLEQLLAEKGVLTREEIDRKLAELEARKAW